MKKAAAQQVSFKGGMIEGIKQDVPFEQGNGTLQSVLWLENYNHTLQEDSAIKRWGEVDSGVPYLDLGYFTPNEVFTYVVNNGTSTELQKSSWLQGVQMYSVVHPEYNDNYTTFLKRYPDTTTSATYDYIPQWIISEGTLQSSEAVAVVSHTIAKDGDSPRWQEVWADGNLDYPGWYTFGTLADVTRYGETLLFTTTLNDVPYFDTSGTKNPVNDYLYPVYRYLYWDIRKKRSADNQFLNTSGTDDYADLTTDTTGKYAKWKILPPAQFIVNNIEVGLSKGVVDNTAFVNVDGSQDSYDINVCIEECSLIGYKVDQIPPTQAVTTSYSAPWLDEEYSTIFSIDDVVMKSPSENLVSMEELDLESLNRFMYGTSVVISGKYTNRVFIPDDNNWYPTFTAVPTSRYPSFSVEGSAGRYSIDTVVTDGGVGTGTNYKGVIGTTLSRYTASLSPRLFLYGEKLDLVLTANISGVEVLLWRGQYTVSVKPGEPVGSPQADMVYNDSPFTVPDAKSPLLTSLYCQGTTSAYDKEVVLLGAMAPQARYLGSYSETSDAVFGYGYHLYHVHSNALYFTVEVRQETMQLFIDSSCNSLSLWCIKPDSSRHIVKSVGTTIESPSGNIYNKPLEQGNEVVDYTKYALLKKFVIDGRTDPPTTYDNWIPSSTLATNAWLKRSDPGVGARGAMEFYTAVPLTAGTSGVPYSSIPTYANDGNVQLHLDLANTLLTTNYWTPDSVIWDYPTETTLFLNSSGKYWKGLGAKLITVIKGRTFIGGCIGADGVEEQAILRYSDVQGGAISPDIFSEERKIQVGHIPHTALLEFREQLWTFSRYQFYRIGLASITQEETWEFFDVVEQGCFNNKSVVVVPYGVCFCNEAGVWLSEGGEPTNLALPILPTYQHISSGTEYLYTTINQLDGVPYIDDKGINPYLELNYDSFNDEIIVYSPLFKRTGDNEAIADFSMVFSFKYKTWRIESSVLPIYQPNVQ